MYEKMALLLLCRWLHMYVIKIYDVKRKTYTHGNRPENGVFFTYFNPYSAIFSSQWIGYDGLRVLERGTADGTDIAGVVVRPHCHAMDQNKSISLVGTKV